MSPVLEGRGMDTGNLNDIIEKLGFARASRPMLIGMAVVLAMAAVAVTHVLSGAAATNDFEITSSEVPTLETSVEPASEVVFVHVSGEVQNPGLYQMDSGSRVADAVNAAGGFTDSADESSCNLARIVSDGEHILIPSTEETAMAKAANDGPPVAVTGASTAPVNINTATAEQLETLPGIGSSTATKIISDRESNGPFQNVEDLARVSGIGQKKLESLEGLICV